MAKNKQINPQELDTFYDAMKDVKPHRQDKIRLSPPVPKYKKAAPPEDDEPIFNLDDGTSTPLIGGEDVILHKHASISNKILRKLKKGQYNVEAKLDLHGMTIDEARHALDIFLQQALLHGARVVLIIHGKGHRSEMPVLKNKLNHWLRHIKPVLAFCSALPQHGGQGATYVLLKNTEEEKFV